MPLIKDHLTRNHAPIPMEISKLMADLCLQDSEPDHHHFSLHEITCLFISFAFITFILLLYIPYIGDEVSCVSEFLSMDVFSKKTAFINPSQALKVSTAMTSSHGFKDYRSQYWLYHSPW